MRPPPVECAHLRDGILRWIVDHGATTEWQDAAHRELRKRSEITDDDDDTLGSHTHAADRSRRH